MKKIISFAITLLFTTMASAQSFRIGPAARIQWSGTQAVNNKMGWAAGVQGDMTFGKENKGLFLDAAVLFDSKRCESVSVGYSNEHIEVYYKYHSYGFTIPVNVGYKFKFSDNFGLFAAAGPYLNIGLGGKAKQVSQKYGENGLLVGEPTEETVSSNIFKDKVMNRVGCGIGFKVGAEVFSHCQVQFGYNLGLTNTFKGTLDKDNKEQSFIIGLAYMF